MRCQREIRSTSEDDSALFAECECDTCRALDAAERLEAEEEEEDQC